MEIFQTECGIFKSIDIFVNPYCSVNYPQEFFKCLNLSGTFVPFWLPLFTNKKNCYNYFIKKHRTLIILQLHLTKVTNLQNNILQSKIITVIQADNLHRNYLRTPTYLYTFYSSKNLFYNNYRYQ